MQEKFSQNVVSGMTDTDAYWRAGYAWKRMTQDTLNAEAYKLRRHPGVAARIAELMGPAAAKAEIDAIWCLQKLEALIDKADERGHSAAAIAGVGQIARIIGADKTVLRDERATVADFKPNWDVVFEKEPARKKDDQKAPVEDGPPKSDTPELEKPGKPLLH